MTVAIKLARAKPLLELPGATVHPELCFAAGGVLVSVGVVDGLDVVVDVVDVVDVGVCGLLVPAVLPVALAPAAPFEVGVEFVCVAGLIGASGSSGVLAVIDKAGTDSATSADRSPALGAMPKSAPFAGAWLCGADDIPVGPPHCPRDGF